MLFTFFFTFIIYNSRNNNKKTTTKKIRKFYAFLSFWLLLHLTSLLSLFTVRHGIPVKLDWQSNDGKKRKKNEEIKLFRNPTHFLRWLDGWLLYLPFFFLLSFWIFFFFFFCCLFYFPYIFRLGNLLFATYYISLLQFAPSVENKQEKCFLFFLTFFLFFFLGVLLFLFSYFP